MSVTISKLRTRFIHGQFIDKVVLILYNVIKIFNNLTLKSVLTFQLKLNYARRLSIVGYTLAQKILKAHLLSGEMTVGNEIGIRIDINSGCNRYDGISRIRGNGSSKGED